MGVLLINDEVKADVAKMIERARAKPVSWEQMKGGALIGHEGTIVQLKWAEEFDPGHLCVNLVQPLTIPTPPPGHA